MDNGELFRSTKAGRKSEIAYQIARRLFEMRAQQAKTAVAVTDDEIVKELNAVRAKYGLSERSKEDHWYSLAVFPLINDEGRLDIKNMPDPRMKPC